MANNVTKLGVLFIALAVAAVMLNPFSVVVNESVNAQPVTNESVKNLNPPPGNWTALNNNDLSQNNVEVRNTSGAVMSSDAYNINYSAGAFNITDNWNVSGADGSTAYVDYNYFTSSYIEDATSRTVANLLPLFMALLILVVIANAVTKRF